MKNGKGSYTEKTVEDISVLFCSSESITETNSATEIKFDTNNDGHINEIVSENFNNQYYLRGDDVSQPDYYKLKDVHYSTNRNQLFTPETISERLKEIRDCPECQREGAEAAQNHSSYRQNDPRSFPNSAGGPYTNDPRSLPNSAGGPYANRSLSGSQLGSGRNSILFPNQQPDIASLSPYQDLALSQAMARSGDAYGPSSMVYIDPANMTNANNGFDSQAATSVPPINDGSYGGNAGTQGWGGDTSACYDYQCCICQKLIANNCPYYPHNHNYNNMAVMSPPPAPTAPFGPVCAPPPCLPPCRDSDALFRAEIDKINLDKYVNSLRKTRMFREKHIKKCHDESASDNVSLKRCRKYSYCKCDIDAAFIVALVGLILVSVGTCLFTVAWIYLSLNSSTVCINSRYSKSFWYILYSLNIFIVLSTVIFVIILMNGTSHAGFLSFQKRRKCGRKCTVYMCLILILQIFFWVTNSLVIFYVTLEYNIRANDSIAFCSVINFKAYNETSRSISPEFYDQYVMSFVGAILVILGLLLVLMSAAMNHMRLTFCPSDGDAECQICSCVRSC